MGNYDKHFWGSREQRKKISGSREHELKTFLGTRPFIHGEQGMKSKKVKGSWEHVPPPPLGGAHKSFDVKSFFKILPLLPIVIAKSR